VNQDPRLFAVMCTFRRPADAAASLEALSKQSIEIASVLVVDNADDPETRAVVESSGLDSRYLSPGRNLGPSGGFALAIGELPAMDHDLVLLLDDDDPLPDHPELLSKMVARLKSIRCDSPSTAGIGLRGGVLNTRTGVIGPRPAGEPRIVPVDHLHGCAYPIYRLGPLRDSQAFDPTLFWGFEELAAGLALRDAGHSLVVAGDLLGSVVDQLPKLAPSTPTRGLSDPSWRNYFRHRNLLRVLRRQRAWTAIAVVVISRMVGKPLVFSVRHPVLSWWHLRTNLAATIDGLGPESRMARGEARRPI